MATTAKQAAVRANDGHVSVLRRLSEGHPAWNPVGWTAGDYRGASKVMGTLRRWGAVEVVTPGHYSPSGSTPPVLAITEFGRAVLAAHSERWSR